jgi:hypothetical protein
MRILNSFLCLLFFSTNIVTSDGSKDSTTKNEIPSHEIKNKVIKIVLDRRANIAKKGKWMAECLCVSEEHEKECYLNVNNPGTDCEGLGYFMCTGKNGNLEEIAKRHENAKITEFNGVKGEDAKKPKHHEPYTVYALMVPGIANPDELILMHYFTHLEGSKYISKTGNHPVRFFGSFADMIKTDGFRNDEVMRTKDRSFTYDLEKASMADRVACSHDDITFTQKEFDLFSERLTDEEARFFKSRIR